MNTKMSSESIAGIQVLGIDQRATNSFVIEV